MEKISKSVRPMTAFMLVSSSGYPMPCSGSMWATGVRQWADKEWEAQGGYETAKKQGWRVRKVLVTDGRFD